tara:strand:- start:13609 stop:14241 length:633 start_codon:yes stop_codon:yes gene_type:complete
MKEKLYVQEGKSRRLAEKINCLRCGKEKLRAKRRSHNKPFCSNKCWNLYQQEQRYQNDKKMCGQCNEYKSLDNFYIRSGKTTYRSTCKQCQENKRKANYSYEKYMESLPKQRITNRKYHIKKYGLTWEDYQKLHEQQNYLCAICKNPETRANKNTVFKLVVDHCHDSGEVRGLLCSRCNTGLGHFKDNVSNLTSAIEYLKEYTNNEDNGT